MIEDTDNQQVIVRYLLGLLPEAETERLDELSFTDQEFAESLRVTEHDLVDAYVQGELSGAELERFNAHYLATPTRRERVRFAQTLQEWTARNPVTTSEAAPRKRKAANRFSALFTTSPRRLRWAIVAVALALCVTMAVLLVQNLRLRRQLTQAQAKQNELLQRERQQQEQLQSQSAANSATEQELARLQREREARGGRPLDSPESGTVVSFMLAPPLRGGGQTRGLSVPAGTTIIKMELQLEPVVDYAAYKVSLLDPLTNQTLWHSGTVKAMVRRKGKVLDIVLPAGLVKSQNYVLRVNGTDPSGQSEIIGDYAFKVVR